MAMQWQYEGEIYPSFDAAVEVAAKSCEKSVVGKSGGGKWAVFPMLRGKKGKEVMGGASGFILCLEAEAMREAAYAVAHPAVYESSDPDYEHGDAGYIGSW